MPQQNEFIPEPERRDRAFRIRIAIERPRRRSVFVGKNIVRPIELVRPLLFMHMSWEPRDGDAQVKLPRAFHGLINFQTTIELGKIDLESPTYASPFNAQSNSTHVYDNGAVCFGGPALELLWKGADPQEVFWSSPFRVLPTWLSAPKPADGVWRENVTRLATSASTALLNNYNSFTPMLSIGDQLKNLRSDLRHMYGIDPPIVIESPWYNGPLVDAPPSQLSLDLWLPRVLPSTTWTPTVATTGTTTVATDWAYYTPTGTWIKKTPVQT